MSMELLLVAVVLVVLVAAIAYVVVTRQRTKALQTRYGPEYDRTVEEAGGRGRAESVLAQREKRVEQFQVHPLSPDEAARYGSRWKAVQARFVDDPSGSIGDADQLVSEVMSARGYPMADFEQRAADISVGHPQVVEHYRAAHDIAQSHRQRPVDTEKLREAFLHYRELFASLLEVEEPQNRGTAERQDRRTEATR